MRVELVEDFELVRAMGYAPDQKRTKGEGVVHQSEIIKDLMCDLQPKRFSRKPFEMSPAVEAGILFESILEQALMEKYATVRPGEIVSPEGIIMSPDGINPMLLAGEEYKATWMSSRSGVVDEMGMPLLKFIHWFIQMMGYAKWLEVLMFVLRVFFVNGNYNRSGKLKDGSPDPDSGPCLKTYYIYFTQAEIDENWSMLINHARHKGMLK